MPWAREPVPDERPDQRTDAARGHQQSEPDVAGVEHLPGEHRDHREHARGGAEPELDRDERPHAAVAARVADRLARRIGDPDMRVVFPRRGERAVYAQQEHRRQRERHGVDDERDVAAEDRGHDASEGRSDREHRPPERAAERVGGREVLGVDDVGQRCRLRGVEDSREQRQAHEQHVREPQVVGPDQQERGADHRAGEVARDHQPAAVEPVGEPPAHGVARKIGASWAKISDRRPRWPRR